MGIGTAAPAAGAALDIKASNAGLLIPRLTAAQRQAIAAPPQGLMVYQTDGSATGGAQTGFWYYAGQPAAWVYLNPSGGAADNLGNHTATQPLNLQANPLVGTGADLGTAVGLGVRADGGLNLGQNALGKNFLLGYQTGAAFTTGTFNQFIGYQSGASTTAGEENQFSGNQSGLSNTTGSFNQFDGFGSGLRNKTGSRNQFVGFQSGYYNVSGGYNQSDGYQSGFNSTSSYNQFSGYQSGYKNASGEENQFSGYNSGYYNTTGSYNYFSGELSGYSNTIGNYNYAVGYRADVAYGNLTNAGALGSHAVVRLSNSLLLGGTGSYAVRVGIGTGAPDDRLHVYGSGTTVLRLQSSNAFGSAGLDFWSDPQGSTNEWRPAAIRSTDAGGFNGGLAFYTNGRDFANRTNLFEQMRVVDGGLAVAATAVGSYRFYVGGRAGASGGFFTASDERLKTHVRPLTDALALVRALHGYRYEWRAAGVARGGGAAGQSQVGVLAQELAAVLPELVQRGPDGYLAVNYGQLAPVLLEAIRAQQRQLDALRREVAGLCSRAGGGSRVRR